MEKINSLLNGESISNGEKKVRTDERIDGYFYEALERAKNYGLSEEQFQKMVNDKYIQRLIMKSVGGVEIGN